MSLNYLKDVEIDESNLAVEWLDQSALAIKYSKNWNHCRMEVMLLEEEIKLVRSELVLKVTTKPSLAKVEKVTAPITEAYYRTHKKYVKVKDKWLKAVEEVNDAEIAKNEICFTRKTALENLVKLHGQNYFSSPKEIVDLSETRSLRKVTKKENNKKSRKKNK